MSSDTDKCPKCGKPLIWCENCFPVFAYCSDTEYCCYETQAKHMEPELVLPPVMHRIRELEARCETLELAALRHMAFSAEPADLKNLAREALKK